MEREKAFTQNTFNTNLLRVSKGVYAEAAPILYSCNTFRFEYEKGLDAFPYFQQRLTETSQASLQSLEFTLPQIQRTYIEYGEECEIFISAFDEWLADTIDGLQGLETVRFHLDQDLMAGDLTFLNQFRNSTGIEIMLKVETSAGYNRNGSYCHDVRMYRDLVPKIRKWGWRVTGQPELVGKSHRFRNQKAWVEELKEDDERAVGFHMRKQSAFITVKS